MPGLSPVRTIVIDAGHGGRDPGAQHHGLREKDVNLDIARRLAGELKARGFSVIMTRDRDEFIALSRRPDVANRHHADLFLSVHSNANRNRNVQGFEVYYPRESRVNTSALPPLVGPQEVASSAPVIRQVLWDVVLARSRHYSVKLASHLSRSMRRRLGVRCRGVRGARFVVLRESWMPSVLVEVGYVSNRSEAARLAQPSYRQAAAQGIADGIVDYIRELGLQHI